MIFLFSNAFIYRTAIAILRMPNGLDYSFILPQPNGGANHAFEHSNNSSSNNLHVASSRIMHVDSNMNLPDIDSNPSPQETRSNREFT